MFQNPRCGAFQFLHSFFNTYLPPVTMAPPYQPNNDNNNNDNNNIPTNATAHATGKKPATGNSKTANWTNTTQITPNTQTDTNTAKITTNATNNTNTTKTTTNTTKTTTNTTNTTKTTTNVPRIHADVYRAALKHRLPMYLHALRFRGVNEAPFRTKMALDPRRVEVGSVHVVYKLRPGFGSCGLNSTRGQLHHYRGLNGGRGHWVVEDLGLRAMFGDSYVWEAVGVLDEVAERKDTE